ncbi:hypothetical protein Nepgr_020504 [Nepenthes gracilis]|uniref:3'-5' exonuclease domain-containing protein n=1 Tax=Nepenthes gracilis TaxID=150966 RepID=A0AAD3SV67_NEPGR|nr:hypothetical protein Nepgr_020504 [Nepenthes gracilis]
MDRQRRVYQPSEDSPSCRRPEFEWLAIFNCKIHHPAATLRRCVGLDCLIFQLLYAEEMTESFFDFLVDENYIFVRVGIDRDVEKLYDEYDLEVENTVDLRRLASKRMSRRKLRNAGLVYSANEVLGMGHEKPKNITLSKWDKPWLSHKLVQYACIDGYLSYKIGRSLL